MREVPGVDLRRECVQQDPRYGARGMVSNGLLHWDCSTGQDPRYGAEDFGLLHWGANTRRVGRRLETGGPQWRGQHVFRTVRGWRGVVFRLESFLRPCFQT